MLVKQLYEDCLSEASYFLVSGKDAVIIDPLRDINQYVELAKENGATIKYIFETHFHADFVSGHIDLAAKTGASIIFGPEANPSYDAIIAKDGQKFAFGEAEIELLHTPGHTVESSCYLLRDENGKEHSVFTGDTLFIGDVGRPDLMGGNFTKEYLAGLMYESLNNKIKNIPDDVIVYPAHGAGSSCGKSLGDATYSTIKEQKAENYALQDISKEDFIKALTEGLTEPPMYFQMNARINRQGYTSYDEVMKKSFVGLGIPEFKTIQSKGAVVLDTRPAMVFAEGFIPGSINIGLDGRYAEWVGSLIDDGTPLLIVCEEGKEEESFTRLTRVGFESMQGYLKGGFSSWLKTEQDIDMVICVDLEEFELDYKHEKDMAVIDVRKPSEFQNRHLKNAVNFPLRYIDKDLEKLDKSSTYYLYCQSGYRSMAASSLLKRAGFINIRNIEGGCDSLSQSKLPMVSEAVNT